MYGKAADCFAVYYTTLLQRNKECQAPQDTFPTSSRLFNNKQELELVTYIGDLLKMVYHLPKPWCKLSLLRLLESA